MPTHVHSSETGRHDNGFALLIVLWMLVLTSFLAALVAARGRTELRITGNLVANGEASAAADGAIYQTIFNLIQPQAELRWPLNSSARQLTIGDCVVDTTLQDEAVRINPNLASPALLEALLLALGHDSGRAQQLALAIGEWIGNAPSSRPRAALLMDYRQSGRYYAPPGAPLQSLDELGSIVGMTPTILATLRPHLSLFAPAEPNPVSTDHAVATALETIRRAGAPASVLPMPPSYNRTVRIVAIAHGPSNAVVSRTAIVKVGPAQTRGFAIVAWDSQID